MTRALAEDVVAAIWLALIVAAGVGYFYAFSLLTDIAVLRFSVGLALSLLCTQLTVVALWALSERIALNPRRYRDGWLARALLVLRRRFRGFAVNLYVLPTVRAFHQLLSGQRSIHPSALLVGHVDIDLLSFVTVGPDAVIDASAHLACVDFEGGPPAPITVGEGAVLQMYSTVGPGTRVGARAVIGAKAVVGRDCVIGFKAVIPPCSVVPDGTEVPGGSTWEG